MLILFLLAPASSDVFQIRRKTFRRRLSLLKAPLRPLSRDPHQDPPPSHLPLQNQRLLRPKPHQLLTLHLNRRLRPAFEYLIVRHPSDISPFHFAFINHIMCVFVYRTSDRAPSQTRRASNRAVAELQDGESPFESTDPATAATATSQS